MKYSKLMRERIRRSRVLFKELGYSLLEGESSEDTFSAAFESQAGFQGGFYIDSDNKFLEIAFTFSFSNELGSFVRDRLEEMLKVCYEFGCYLNVQTAGTEIEFSVYSKLYYAGLNYFSLRETLRDFEGCVDAIKEIVDIHGDTVREG